jgi:hypothetical protein
LTKFDPAMAIVWSKCVGGAAVPGQPGQSALAALADDAPETR